MNRLTDNDKNWGPFTLARWNKCISFALESGDEEDPESKVTIVAFGWALRCRVPNWVIRPYKEKHIALSWDAATVERMGRNWYYSVYPREFGVSLSNLDDVYDFLQVHYGPQTHDSSTTKSWCKHLPWKDWSFVRHSHYNPDGSHFFTPEKGANYFDSREQADKCPSSSFEFEDFDGEKIVAQCRIEEREWHRGSGWFKWLKWFYRPKINRDLDIKFSAEVGKEKGSWKGGTLGHGVSMTTGETPQQAFERYCVINRLRFISPCEPVKTVL